MDSIRVSKVENVTCSKGGSHLNGTVHLTAHHLIFQYRNAEEKELWVPYPLISLVTRLPQTIHGKSPVTFHLRTFETFSLLFNKDPDASDVFESVKELTVATSVHLLYAFFYSPNPPLSSGGWNIYSPREEFGRMGVGSRTKAWRFTDINKDYSFSPTYPARMVVPTRISDTTLQYASKYRSKSRIPVLSYLHWNNYGCITRSSQPMVGITQNRSIQDEKLIEAVFQSHHSPDSRSASGPVYGATTTNLIIDARPTANAMANTAKGAGTENMDHYKDSRKVYLGIDHIHTMRESLAKVVDALREADTLLASINNDLSDQITGISVLDRQALRRSGWLRHISAILEGTNLIARNIHVNSSHVLIHCSDGWDRTSQLSSLSQLCLDPFYRTIRGFEILIEKDWLSFGHKFLDRCGHLSSDKFFVSTPENVAGGEGPGAAQALLAFAQNRFASQNHLKETSPVFHQFLESVRQIQRQFPTRFEFNERFLSQLYYHLYSCQFGTFLFNSERERRVGDGIGPPPCDRTISVWDYLNSPAELTQNTNASYDASLDDPANRTGPRDMGVLLPNPKDVRFWNELYGRTDEEMNGRVVTGEVVTAEILGPGDNNPEDPIIQRTATPTVIPLPPSPSRSPPQILAAPLQTDTSTPTMRRSVSPNLPSQAPLQDDEDSSHPSTISRDSFRPFGQSSSSFSMKPPNMPPSSGVRHPAVTPDFMSGSGVRSIWGKLSSNASAAFSVVQEAYVGTSKDVRGNELSGERTEELRGMQGLDTWRDSPSSSCAAVRTPPQRAVTSNPWAMSISPSTPSYFSPFDNPWGTTRGGELGSSPRERNMAASTFAPDPTVSAALVTQMSPAPVESNVDLSRLSLGVNRQPETPRQSSRSNSNATAPGSTDPLGVGPI